MGERKEGKKGRREGGRKDGWIDRWVDRQMDTSEILPVSSEERGRYPSQLFSINT